MDNYLPKVIYQWLYHLKYDFSFKIIQKELTTHPDFPHATSIKDFLDKNAIRNLIAELPLSAINKLDKPFLAYIKIGMQEQFALSELNHEELSAKLFLGENKIIKVSLDKFKEYWTGLVVVVEESESAVKQKFTSSFHYILAAILILIPILSFLGGGYQLSQSYLLLSSIAGIYISVLMIQQDLGYDSALLSYFCKADSNKGCDKVINSKFSVLYGEFKATHLNLCYYLVCFFSFISYNVIGLGILPFIVVAFIASVISIWIQFKIIKQWCRLCLISSALIWSQFFVLNFFSGFLIFNSIGFIITALLFSALLLSIKNLMAFIKKSGFDHLSEIESLSFRKNHYLLMPYFASINKVDTSIKAPVVVRERTNSFLKIIVITNPFCETCFDLHWQMKDLQFDEIEISYRFFVPYENREDPRTIISERLLEITYEEGRDKGLRALDDWFENRDFIKWVRKWGKVKNPMYNRALAEHKSWCYQVGIDYTPAIIINEKIFPSIYRPTDIQYHIASLKELYNKGISADKEAAK